MIGADGIDAQNMGRLMGGLVSTRQRDSAWDVRTPLLYPSGAAVGVEVSGAGDEYRVSDMGLGFGEAFAMDVSTPFSRAAKELSAEYGVIYDKRRIFLPKVSEGKLGSAIKLVANCSQTAVVLAAERANDRKAEERADRLFNRLRRLFPNTAKQACIKGFSQTEWTVDALVVSDDRVAVFDAVTKHANSVASTATKFQDLALLEEAPLRAAAVESRVNMGTLLAVLAQSARVIEDGATDQQFRQIAIAA